MKEVRKPRRCNRATISRDIMRLQENLLEFCTLRREQQRGAWHALYMMCSVHGVTESQMRLNNNNTDVFGINAITCVMLAIFPTFPVFSLDPAFLPSIGLLRS